MFNKLLLGVTALAASFTALPAEAQAQGYYDRGGYGRYYDYDRRDYRQDRRQYRREVRAQRRYERQAYRRGYYNDRGHYGRGHSGGYYGRSYDRGYYGRGRCGSGTTGAIVGGAGGALLGREIGRGGRGYYGRRGSGTTGAVIGGVAGALLGREIGRSC